MAKKQPQHLEQTKQFVRNFLRINDAKEFLMFLFFLLAAFVFWYLTTMNQEYEMSYSVKTELKHLPNDVILTEPMPKVVKVVLKDRGDKLVEYKARGKMETLDIDYRQHARTGRTAIYGAELEKLLRSKLASSTEIVSVTPDTLLYYAAEARGVKLPVRWQGRIEADRQYVIEQVRLVPDSVVVYAAKQLTDTMTAVYMPIVEHVGLTDSLKLLLAPGREMWGVRYEPDAVEMNVAVSPYVVKRVQVPVEGYMFPYGQELKTFPSKVEVAFRVSLDNFREVTEEDFKILVRHVHIRDNNSGKVAISLDEMPDNVTDIVIEPTEVDYLIEMNAPFLIY
jgi:hypothetical protein